MAAGNNRVGAMALLVAWVMTAAAMVARAVLTAATTPLILDADDAMRLTEVHDFLGGQGWFDLVQHRMNAPFGAAMHWSRLIDLPEAVLLAVIGPLAGGGADTLAAYIWPLLLLVPLLWLTAKIAIRLGGPEARWPALLLPAFSLITLSERPLTGLARPVQHSAQHDDRGDHCGRAREASGEDEVPRRRKGDCLHNSAHPVSLAPDGAVRCTEST